MSPEAQKVAQAAERLQAARRELQAAEAEFAHAQQTLCCGSVAADGLAARGAQVLTLVRQGLTNKEIGNALNITERTVKFHVSHLLAHFHVSDRRQLMLLQL